MITLLERARRYVAVMPAGQSGSGGHNATFAAACALVKGFGLSIDEARPILQEFNGRCSPPWSDAEIEHKLRSADGSADPEPRGYLIGDRNDPRGSIGSLAPAKRESAPKPVYDPERLKTFAGDWAKVVDLVWLANRSHYDPAEVDAAGFLSLLYGSNERVVVFTKEYSQGQALWPDDEVPTTGRCGVWYLAQPVDGVSYPNPRSKGGTLSRRSEESVTTWRYLVLESDSAPLREWLGALVQLPLKIAAIYSSGGRSVHALVRVDAATKKHWDDMKLRMAPGLRFLILNGADKGVLSAVRLTRLPGCLREGKEKDGVYTRFPTPQMQKLLYVNPRPEARPLAEQFAKRDVESEWMKTAEAGRAAADVNEKDWIEEGLRYYAPVSPQIREALKTYGERRDG
jgi:hypothetical protein